VVKSLEQFFHSSITDWRKKRKEIVLFTITKSYRCYIKMSNSLPMLAFIISAIDLANSSTPGDRCKVDWTRLEKAVSGSSGMITDRDTSLAESFQKEIMAAIECSNKLYYLGIKRTGNVYLSAGSLHAFDGSMTDIWIDQFRSSESGGFYLPQKYVGPLVLFTGKDEVLTMDPKSSFRWALVGKFPVVSPTDSDDIQVSSSLDKDGRKFLVRNAYLSKSARDAGVVVPSSEVNFAEMQRSLQSFTVLFLDQAGDKYVSKVHARWNSGWTFKRDVSSCNSCKTSSASDFLRPHLKSGRMAGDL